MTRTDRGLAALWLSALLVVSAFAGVVAFSGVAAAGNSNGSVSLSINAAGDTGTVTVDDPDLNTDSGTKQRVTVNVESDSEKPRTSAVKTSSDTSDGGSQTVTVSPGDLVVDRNNDGSITKADFTLSGASDESITGVSPNGNDYDVTISDAGSSTTDSNKEFLSYTALTTDGPGSDTGDSSTQTFTTANPVGDRNGDGIIDATDIKFLNAAPDESIKSVTRNADGSVDVTVEDTSGASDGVTDRFAYLDSETAVLVETGSDTGKFSGTFSIVQTDAVGKLKAADGDGVRAFYWEGSNKRTASQTLSLSDTTAPTISDVYLGEKNGNLKLSFDSSEQLGGNSGDVTVSVDGPNSGTDWKTFDRTDFTETANGDGTYTYTLSTTQAYDDGSGSYTATVDDAKDSAGNNGGVNGQGSGLSDSHDTTDSTAPSISGVTFTDSNGFDITFDSDEQLGRTSGDVTVEVTGPNGKTYTFDRSQFSESLSGGTYTYTLTASQSFDDGDGTYTAEVKDAKDASGNNGGTNGQGSGLSDTYDFSDTTAPSISSVTLSKSSGRVKISFVSDEQLGADNTDVRVTVDAPIAGTDWKTFYRNDFTEKPLQNGKYKYTLDQNGYDSGEGTYTLTIDDAKDASGNNGGVNGQGSGLSDTYDFNPSGSAAAIVSKDVEYVSGAAKFQNDAEVEKNIHWNTQLSSRSFEFRLWVAGNELGSGDQQRNLSLAPVGFDESTKIKVRFTVKNYNPNIMMGAANVSSWTVNDKAGNKKEIVVTLHPTVVQRNFNAPFAPSRWDPSKAGYQKSWEQAQFGVDALVNLQTYSFPQGSGLSKLDGARLNTDAQAFTVPTTSNGQLVFNVAAPHCKVGAKSDPNDPAAADKCNSQYVNNDGFYEAVIPKAFWQDQWGSDLNPSNMSLVYTSGGTTETLTNVKITKQANGNIYLEAKGIHYSSGDIKTLEDTTDPTASAGSDKSVTAGTSVSFDGTGSSDSETTVTKYQWDVDGDGTYEKTGSTPSHTYSEPGTYTVTLKVTDDGSNADTDTVTVTVESSGTTGSSDNGQNLKPVVVSRDGDHTDVTVREPSADMQINFSAAGRSDQTVVPTRLSFDAETEKEFRLTVSTSTAVPEGTPAPAPTDIGGEAVGFLRVDHSVDDSELSNVTIRFTVSWAALGNGTNEHDLVLYRYHDGEWRALDTRVVGYTTHGAVLEADSPGLSVFAVGSTKKPALSVTDATLGSTTVTAGEQVTVSATVANDGTAEGTATVRLVAGGAVRDTASVTLAPGESKTVELTATFDAPGSYDLAVDGTGVGSVAVESAATATATPTPTPATTPTPTATATPTPAATATPAPTPTATATATPAPTAADGPGFGPLLALLAVAVAVLGRAWTRQ